MKTILVLLVLAAGGYYYYNHYYLVAQAQAAHRYSADDVFYLRQYVSVKTAKGLVGWVPGQQLNLCDGHVPGKIMVTDGSESMPLSEDLLTHDLDEAAALRANDTQTQAELLAQVDEAKHIAAAREAKAHAVNSASAPRHSP